MQGPGCATARPPDPTVAEPVRFPDTDWPSAECQRQAARLTAELSLREKIGQMTLVDTSAISRADVTAFVIGAAMATGQLGTEVYDASHWRQRADRFHEAGRRGGLRVPLLFGATAIHGHNDARGAVIFPQAIGLGATHDPGLVERVAAATGEELAATGVDWTFAPMLAVARDDRWGRSYECFSEEPELVAQLGAAYVRGLQGTRAGIGGFPVMACAEQYVGAGASRGGQNHGPVQITAEELAAHLTPYEAAVRANVASVQVATHDLNGRPVQTDGNLLTRVLKDELAFHGFVVSNERGLETLPGSYVDRVASVVTAGVDMMITAGSHERWMRALRALVPDKVSEERVDDAVFRILTMKCQFGRFASDQGTRPPLSVVGSPKHRAVAREAVARSIVLLKNDGILPLSKRNRVFLAGAAADDLGRQCGGWTLRRQGGNGRSTSGTTIRDGLEQAIGQHLVRYVSSGEGAWGSVAVVVVGEQPYAEAAGDRMRLELPAEDIETVRTVARSEVPVVVVLITGRPVDLTPVLDLANAILVAWLPGTEGGGVADVLFGDVPPTGRLSRSWPKGPGPRPTNVGDPDYDPLFEYGFGLPFTPR